MSRLLYVMTQRHTIYHGSPIAYMHNVFVNKKYSLWGLWSKVCT